MSFELLFIAYEQAPPSVLIAARVSEVDETVPKPQFDSQRIAVVADLKTRFPAYVYTVSDKGERFGGLLGTEDGALPDINLWASHAHIDTSFQVDPEQAQEELIQIAKTFERHRFAIYDPENDRMWTSAELEAWLPQAIRDEQSVLQEIKEGRVEFKEKKPWWRFW